MPKQRLDVNWKRERDAEGLMPVLKRYRRYLEDNWASTVHHTHVCAACEEVPGICGN